VLSAGPTGTYVSLWAVDHARARGGGEPRRWAARTVVLPG
jgi:hypothetical protein